MKSTGLYHIKLYNYFSKSNYNCYIINPIHTKNFAKQSIRKVKNDKVDPFSKVPLAILRNYPTYKHFLSATKSDVLTTITSAVHHTTKWAENRYNKIFAIAKEAELLKLDVDYLETELICFIDILNTFEKNINKLESKISEITSKIPNFKKNVELLCTHPEVGKMSAIYLLAEIGNIENFSKPQKLVAFLGLDTSVSQSGAFTSTHNRLTKRGSKFARKTLYNLARASVKTFRNGVAANPVLHEYYKKLITSKLKKVAFGAIMHKLVQHFFEILRDQKPFELRLPEVHKTMYLEKNFCITGLYVKKAN